MMVTTFKGLTTSLVELVKEVAVIKASDDISFDAELAAVFDEDSNKVSQLIALTDQRFGIPISCSETEGVVTVRDFVRLAQDKFKATTPEDRLVAILTKRIINRFSDLMKGNNETVYAKPQEVTILPKDEYVTWAVLDRLSRKRIRIGGYVVDDVCMASISKSAILVTLVHNPPTTRP